MIMKTTVTKKNVCYGNKRYQLTYRLLLEDDLYYGVEVICRHQNTVETERIRIGKNKQEALKLLRLFAKETVFPVALKETWENL